MKTTNKLVLGTAQLGLSYGIANKIGQPDFQMAKSIINEAWINGIREFDTAQGYGASEYVLGKVLSELDIVGKVKIISKFNPNIDHLDHHVMSNSLNESLKKIGVPEFYGMMLHREEFLSQLDKGLAKILSKLVSSGKVRHIGVSVYSPDKAVEALNTECIDMVQIPTNILDRRFEDAGVFQLAKEKKKKIYIRSIFLQGLILMDTKTIPERMAFAKPVIDKIEFLSEDLHLTKHELALGYIKSEMTDAKIVIGADTPEQVKENCEYWKKTQPESIIPMVKEHFKQIEERILNPVLWPK